MKKILHSSIITICLVAGSLLTADAQFIADSSQTYFVCNATGSQVAVSAFGDGNGGTYSLWIDRRNGTAGTAIYGQHLDSLGVPQWATNGKLFFQENGKEIWLMHAVAWQSGILIGWVQGGFGIGGDTLFCNYYDANGVSQWAQPVVVANKQGSIVYVNIDDLTIYPNDSGATITYGLTPIGGNNYFSFNRIDFSGNLRWPVDSFAYQGNGYYYHTGYDNHNGFYVATSTGGLGAPIYLGHFDLQGNQTIATPVDITGTAGGRGNSQWMVLCDNDTAAYIVWASYTNQNISISKINRHGTLLWPNAKSICAATGTQDYPYAMIKNDTIYAIWDDPRVGGSGYQVYMQKIDTAGNMLWTPDGIELCNLPAYLPYPKLISSGANVAATYSVSDGFRGQIVHPDSTIVFAQNGVNININNLPFYGDCRLVSTTDGRVTVIWRETGDNICAARLRPNGILSSITEPEQNTSGLFPNPASDQFRIQLSGKSRNALISIHNSLGELVFQKNADMGNETMIVNTENFSEGFYVVTVSYPESVERTKICVVRK